MHCISNRKSLHLWKKAIKKNKTMHNTSNVQNRKLFCISFSLLSQHIWQRSTYLTQYITNWKITNKSLVYFESKCKIYIQKNAFQNAVCKMLAICWIMQPVILIIYWPLVPIQITRFMGRTWGPPGSCCPQVSLMLAPWTLLSGYCCFYNWKLAYHC